MYSNFVDFFFFGTRVIGWVVPIARTSIGCVVSVILRVTASLIGRYGDVLFAYDGSSPYQDISASIEQSCNNGYILHNPDLWFGQIYTKYCEHFPRSYRYKNELKLGVYNQL